MEYKKHFLSLVFVLVVFFLTHQFLYASLKFERFSNKEGFNQNTITAIAEDTYGFLWFGTPNGLIKYDGYEFVSYTSDPDNDNSISNNYVLCLYHDSQGILWIGTKEGLNVYLPRFEKFLKVPAENVSHVDQIREDYKGRIWISGGNALHTCKIDLQDDNVSFNISENILDEKFNVQAFRKFCFAGENFMLFSQFTGLFGLNIEHPGSERHPVVNSVLPYETLSGFLINDILVNENIFWIGTDNGLYKTILDGERLHVLQKFEVQTWDNRRISDLKVLNIFQDKTKNIWIGTADEGIFKYNQETDDFVNYGYDPKNPNGISSSRINCFLQDKYDVLWIGTAQGGVNKLDLRQKQFISYSNNPYSEETVSDNLINAIHEDSRGFLWIASYNGSLCRSMEPVNPGNINRLRFERLSSQLPLEKLDFITTIYEDRKGYIWIGSDFSVVVYNPEKKQFKKIILTQGGDQVSLSFCRVIDQIDDNHLILGGTDLVVLKNPWTIIQQENHPRIEVASVCNEPDLVKSFLQTKDGNFWIGTENGLYKSEFRSDGLNLLKRYTAAGEDTFSLSNNDIFTLYEDRNGSLWVGTFGGGLNKLVFGPSGEIERILTFRKNNLLPDDAVYGILEENDKHIWISTDMGLCRFNISNNTIDLFDVRDGLINNNFRQSAYHKGKTGILYFGGLNGLTIFDPEDIRLNEILSNPLITGLSINNNRLNIGDKLKGKHILKKTVLETTHVAINQGVKMVTFHLVAQQSATPAKNKLAYKLEGFNNEWIQAESGKSSVTYTNLPSGDYVLRVKSANGDGLWTDKTADLRLTILPPWYKTWWSYSLSVILLLTIITGVSVYVVRLEKLKQRLKYEQIDKQRIDSTNQGKLQFFTNISHEFRTPLTLIAGPLEKVIEKNRDREITHHLRTIQNNTKRLLSLVDQLITFRKAELGHLALRPVTDTLGNFIYPATEAFEDYAIQKNINFFYKINSPNEIVTIDVEKTERIIFNLLSNSFRNTPAQGNISIETDIIMENSGEKMICIKVIDTGRGIPPEKIGKIFERFFQVEERKESARGTGIGLAFCKSLIDLMGGTISVESEPDIRTCFTIIIPSGSSNNSKTEIPEYQGQSFIKAWIPDQGFDANESMNNVKNSEKADLILVVDDEAEVRDFLKATLDKNYTIVTAENGKDGYSKMLSNHFDLVISDIMMPEMNGFELCEKIKTHPDTSHVPVILLTALGDEDNVIKGFEYNADDYISKPFSPKHLEIRIGKLIENNRRLKEYFSKKSSMPDSHIKMSDRDKTFLHEVIQAIENHISESDFGVEELAFELRLSPSQFYRRLKQLTGQIPNVYLRNYRLQRASELLNSPEGLNVAEVMYRIGIESHSYFSTAFKKIYGVSPSEFVKKNHP